MNDNIHLVHREETFEDLAVKELARSRAKCICMLQFGRCKEHECKTCSSNQHYINCYSMFSDYNKTRCDTMVNDYYLVYSMSPSKWSSFSNMIRRTITAAVATLTVVSGIFAAAYFISKPMDKPKPNSSDKVNTAIISTLKESHEKLKDINRDGLINCIDYTLMFKLSWDEHYNESECEIVRNRNAFTGMHHLFIRVKCYNNYIYVEPWCENITKYRMEENWDNTYNSYYNIYGETKYWLGEVKK